MKTTTRINYSILHSFGKSTRKLFTIFDTRHNLDKFMWKINYFFPTVQFILNTS